MIKSPSFISPIDVFKDISYRCFQGYTSISEKCFQGYTSTSNRLLSVIESSVINFSFIETKEKKKS